MTSNPAVPDRAAVRIFPPAVPLLTIAAGVVLERMIPTALSIPEAVRWSGGVLAIGSVLFLGAWSVALVRRSGQSENPWKPTTGVIRSGPFRLTRNPMYLQMVLVTFGLGIAFENPWILALTPLCGIALQLLAIRPEEEYLERKFGEEYLQYKARVPRWL